MRRAYLFQAAGAVVFLSVGTGCAGPGAAARNGLLASSMHPYEPDIPVPVGFRLVDQASEDWSTGQLRYVRHRYVGRADKYAVRKFYLEQMPLVRWAAISDGNVHGHVTMRFQRGAESCTVTIEDEAAGLGRRVAVEVLISPAAR